MDHEAASLAWLDATELRRLRRFRFRGARRRFSLCRAALRAELAGRLACLNEQITFGAHDHGKPFVMVDGERRAISFNVSHSGDHGLIAFGAAGSLGIDVEELRPRRDMDGLIETVFTANEQAVLSAVEDGDRMRLFFDFWTMKEALLKALGTGLSMDPASFEIPPTMQGGRRWSTFRFPDRPAVAWRLDNIGTEALSAAVAREIVPAPAPDSRSAFASVAAR